MARRQKSLTRYIAKMSKLQALRHITEKDLERAHRGAFIEFVNYYERSIERLFIGLLCGNAQIPGCSPRFKVSFSQAEAIVRGGKEYIDWMPYDHTMKRSRLYFDGGYPFVDLSDTEKDVLRKMTYIRNALAHESGTALNKFQKACIGQRALTQRQRHPEVWLMGMHAGAQTRFSYYTGIPAMALQSLCR